MDFDVIVIGAGAAGLFFAGLAAQKGMKVLVLDHRAKIGEKIRISGGGRCNFTNIYSQPGNFLSQNPHFAKSALARFTPDDFLKLVRKYGIPYHEKKMGQMFCDHSAQDIIDMLFALCPEQYVTFQLGQPVQAVQRQEDKFTLTTADQHISCPRLVIATGGLSIPKIGATGFGYDVARQFGLNVITTRPALVPLTFDDEMARICRELSGLSVEAKVMLGATVFQEGLLFSHRGLTGPSILQISSYWQEGMDITVNLAPQEQLDKWLQEAQKSKGKQDIHTVLAAVMPQRLAAQICNVTGQTGRISELSKKSLATLSTLGNAWQLHPIGTEGYKKAEVTLGGVDTHELSSKDMQAKRCPGLYFIGEVVDVTGHLGGHNFQWAWASAHAAATHMSV